MFIRCHGQAMMIFRGNIDNDENLKRKYDIGILKKIKDCMLTLDINASK